MVHRDRIDLNTDFLNDIYEENVFYIDRSWLIASVYQGL